MNLRIVNIAFCALTLICAGGCSTGIDSTPKIKSSEVRKNRADGISAEQAFLADINPTPPRDWVSGQTRFLVDEQRISMIFTSASASTDDLEGKILIFDSFADIPSLNGQGATEIAFHTDDGKQYFYQAAITKAQVDTIADLEIPFTVAIDASQKIDSIMSGKTFYISTQNWYDSNNQKFAALRHIPVMVDSVTPGNARYPAFVYFHIADASRAEQVAQMGANRPGSHVMMTFGQKRTSTRNFETLFTFDNPRKKYSDISDAIWELIIRGKVAKGMTRDECRLALGAPNELNRFQGNVGFIELWSYDDGMYLQFVDGYLSQFRL